MLARDHRLAVGHSFDNASDALVAVSAGRPEVILCGLEALPHLRAACPDTVIVMYTANPEGSHEAVALGADAVVGKDTVPTRLFEQVVELLEQRAYSS